MFTRTGVDDRQPQTPDAVELLAFPEWNSYCVQPLIDLTPNFAILIVDRTKSPMSLKKQKKNFVNPFIKLIQDKMKIADAVKAGKPLSTLENIKFIKPRIVDAAKDGKPGSMLKDIKFVKPL